MKDKAAKYVEDKKTLTDYFVESQKDKGEEFKKNNPNLAGAFDALNHTATAMAIEPDFMFNPEKYENKKEVDQLTQKIYGGMETVGASFSNNPLLVPYNFKYLGYIENDVDSSEASMKLKIASGVGILKLKEIVEESKREELPEDLRDKPLKDLRDALSLSMYDLMKEIGINRSKEDSLPANVKGKTIESIFSNETKITEKETLKEKETNKTTEVNKVNEATPLPAPAPVPAPEVTSVAKTEPVPIASESTKIKKQDEILERVITSESGAKIATSSPAPISNVTNVNNVANTNKTEVAKTVNESRPTSTQNKNVSSTSVVSNVTNTSPVVENKPVIKSEQPTEIIRKETTSSTGGDLGRGMESFIVEGTVEPISEITSGLNSMLGIGEPVKASSTTSTKIESSIREESPKSVLRSEIPPAPKEIVTVKKMEGPKISPAAKTPETKKEEGRPEEKAMSSTVQEGAEETTVTGSETAEAGQTKTPASVKNEEPNKDLQESLSRIESLMAELVRIMKGPILTIDGKINYS